MDDAADGHALLSARWSPTTFKQVNDVTVAEVASLLEGGVMGSLGRNSQPWTFILCAGAG